MSKTFATSCLTPKRQGHRYHHRKFAPLGWTSVPFCAGSSASALRVTVDHIIHTVFTARLTVTLHSRAWGLTCPSPQEGIAAHSEEALHSAGVSILLELMKFIFLRVHCVWWKTFVVALLDQLHNAYYMMQFFLRVVGCSSGKASQRT